MEQTKEDFIHWVIIQFKRHLDITYEEAVELNEFLLKYCNKIKIGDKIKDNFGRDCVVVDKEITTLTNEKERFEVLVVEGKNGKYKVPTLYCRKR